MALIALRDALSDIGTHQGLDRLGDPFARIVHLATKRSAIKNALSGNWLGHQLHPMLTDIPIGAWAMATLVDYTLDERGGRAARRLVGAGILCAVPTAAAGASDWSDSYGGDRRVGLVHGLANMAATVVHTISWLERRRGHRRAGIVLSTVGLGLTAGASYVGGHLSFGRGVGVNNTSFQPPVTAWVDVASLSDLEDHKPERYVAGTVPVMLVKVGDTVEALSATCTHASGPLDGGTVADDPSHGPCIVCPWHGSVFRLADGSVVRGPASVPQQLWQVRIEAGRVSVMMLDPVPDH
ncbi:MAG: Rieske 2Fe-2S domain-containing protein [Acidimicrobiia bacterium]